MDRPVLKVEKRELMGKKARFLRRQGIVPANIYGHGLNSLAVECEATQLESVVKGGTSRVIELNVKGEKKQRNVIIKDVLYHPIDQGFVHVDFYQVKMTEAINADIPIRLTGHAPALEFKENFLDHQLNEIEIECLPDKLPQHIDVNINGLEKAGQAIYVEDLDLGPDITVLTPADNIIVRVDQAAAAELEEEGAAPEVEVEEAEEEEVIPEAEE